MDEVTKLERESIEDVTALTPLQEGMLFHFLKDRSADFYFEQLSLGISGLVDIALFEKAWNLVVATNGSLRTVFRWERMADPIQVVLKEHRPRLRYHDLFTGSTGADEAVERLERIKKADRNENFDLREVPFRVTLCRITEIEYELIISNHHILYDGWSTGIIIREFFNAYNDLVSGTVPVSPVKTSFKEFVRWNKQQDIQQQESFWEKYLEGVDWENRTELPFKNKKPGAGGIGSSVFQVSLSSEKKTLLDNFVKKHRITTAAFLYGAWGHLLQKYTGSSDVIMGTTVSGRSAKIAGIEEVVGLFINTIPLRVRTVANGGPGENGSLPEMLTRLNDELQMRETFENTPLLKIKEYGKCNGKEELFDSIFVIENYPLDIRRIRQKGPLHVCSYSMVEATHYDLTAAVGISDRIDINFIYHDDVLSEAVIRQLSSHFTHLIDGILDNPYREISEIDILSVEEKQRILKDFNNTDTPYPADKTVHTLFEEQVEKSGKKIAVESGNENFGIERRRLSYEGLNGKANRLARFLRALGVGPGTIAGLMVERSVDMVAAVLAILKAGGAYSPIDPEYPDNRIIAMLDSSGAQFLLTTGDIYNKKSLSASHTNNKTRVILMDKIERELEEEPAGNLVPLSGPGDLIYIIFTSGSTGTPKGAGVYHRGFMNLMHWFISEFGLEAGDSNLLFTSLSFDLTQKNLYASLIRGGTLYLPGINYFEPEILLKEIHRNGINWINCTPGMFYKLVEYEETAGEKQLSSLRYVFLGGEPVSLAGLIRWLEAGYHNAQIVNTYGPTECTDICAFYRITEPRRFLTETIPVGYPVYNARLYVPGKDLRPLPVGIPGELVIGGDGVGYGYVNDKELTASKFFRHSFSPGEPEQLLYRTGDLVKWLPDGAIEFIGRIDHQVKIRGFRIEPGEIEKQLLTLEDVKETVVVPIRGDDGTAFLCAYIVPRYMKSFRESGIRKHLSGVLPDYMVPAFFIPLEKMPLSPNGKVDRRALPKPDFQSARTYIPPRNTVERSLATAWSAVLGIEEKRIGIDDNFFELGGHSLKAVGLVGRIHKNFNVKISIPEFFEIPTVRELALHIEKKKVSPTAFIPVHPVEEKEYYVLSSAQKRFFIIQKIIGDNTSYNMTETMQLEGELDFSRFETAFKKTVERHESLRTSFHLVGGIPVQRVHPTVDYKLDYYDSEIESNLAVYDRPFDLSTAPLLRTALFKVGKSRHLLTVTMHHIIADGASTGIFIKNFLSFYRGDVLPLLRVQYRDYAEWQQWRMTLRDANRGNKDTLSIFDEDVLNLPTDFQRPVEQDYEGNNLRFELGSPETAALYRMTLEKDVTLYMILLAAFNVLLSKLSGQETILVGSPIAGRSHNDVEDIIGLFINTIVLRNQPSGEKPFPVFLEEVKTSSLEVFESQDHIYEELLEKIGSLPGNNAGNPGRNPLFDVMLVLQNMELPEVEIEGLKITRDIRDTRSSKFDLTVYCEEKGDTLQLKAEYAVSLFKKETMCRFMGYYKKVISEILENPDRRIKEIEIISVEERKQLIYDFNETAVPYAAEKTVVNVLEEQAARTPEAIAVSGPVIAAEPALIHETRRVQDIRYKELNEKANRLARYLKSRGVAPGTVTGIMIERSIEMIVGVQAILKAGGAYLPIDPEYPDNRIVSMLENSKASVVLTTGGICDAKSAALTAGDRDILFIELDRLGEKLQEVSGLDMEPAAGPKDMIYIIFTSGSTGSPRGAGVYHRGFMNLMHWFVTDFELNANDSNLFLTSLSFDLTQKNLYASLMKGGKICIPPVNYFEPVTLLREILHHGVTWINCTPSMFYKLVEHEESLDKKHLGTLRYVFLGGEPISFTTLIHWLESDYHHALIVNTYGPTECTDICASYRITEPRRFLKETIPVGFPIYNVQMYVVDKNLGLQPVGVPGELTIGGDGVGTGYVNDKALTSRKFVLNSFGAGEPDRLLYRTGDLVKWCPDGTVEFIGRLDHQVKIRGYRIELGEIESVILTHDNIKETVVTPRESSSGDKYLCAYVVPHDVKKFRSARMQEFLAKRLPDYMVPPYFVALEKMPLNPNGKVDRGALPEPDMTGGDDYVPPRNEREKLLTGLWSEVLGVDRGRIGIHDNFFRLGGHSLKATTLIGRIYKVFSVELPIGQLFKNPTIESISRLIELSGGNVYSAIEAVEKREYYPVSSAQKRLFVVHGMEAGSVTYNIPAVFALQGKIEKERFEDTFRLLIERHESLRTSFITVNGEPVQRVHETAAFSVEYIEPGPPSPFDLSRPPLMRAGLVKQSETEHLLILDMHHIISDGISMSIFAGEFMKLYRGETPRELTLQYKDFSHWQNHPFAANAIKKQEEYWRAQFQEGVPTLELPYDFARPAVQRFEGNSIRFNLESGAGKEALEQLALQGGTTLYTVLFALFNLLLSRLSGKEEIVVGTPVAGRRHPDLENIIGMFVNILPVRTAITGQASFDEFLEKVKENLSTAFENQDYQYEELLEKLNIKRDLSRNPLYDTVFVLQNMENREIEIPGLTLTQVETGTGTSKFDLTLNCMEKDGELQFGFEYCTALFEEITIRRFIEFSRKLISDCLKNPRIPLSNLEIISEEEKRQLVIEFNNTAREYPADKTIGQLFREQAEKTPGTAAVLFDHEFITYEKLRSSAHTLAARLRQKGVAPDSPVGILSDRSIETIVGILAVLEAGGAYLPIDPEYPAERIDYLLADTGASILISTPVSSEEGKAIEPARNSEIRFLREPSNTNNLLTTPPSGSINSRNLAYIIYTSGSTGIPRGVLVEHRSVVRLVKNTNFIEFRSRDRILQTGVLAFDASTFEIWGALLNGLTLCLTDKAKILTPRLLKSVIRKYDIRTIWMTSPLFNRMLEADIDIFDGLGNLLVGGDALSPSHINRLRARYPRLKVINGYGPTENTTFSTTFSIEKEYSGNIPIGSPIANSTAYIVDKYNNPQPVKVPGELCVGGDGVARGYLNAPELTAERFNRSYRTNRSYILYKTGDLARWLPDGTIEFLGRIDHQVKIRGFRVELGEIENRLLKIDGVKEAVVTVDSDERGDKYICAYTSPTDVSAETLKQSLSKLLPNYMIPSYFISLDKLPLNFNGKIDRKSLPKPHAAGTGTGETGGYVPPRNPLEQRLTEIWQQLLNLPRIGIHDDFFDIGGHSLKALHLLNSLQNEFQVKIDFQDIFQYPTIAELCSLLRESRTSHSEEIEKQPEKEYYELSFAQKRLWLLYQLDPDDPAYNIPERITFREAVEEAAIVNVLEKLASRHDAFRTSIKLIHGKSVQVIAPAHSPGSENSIPVKLETIDISHLNPVERENARAREFEKESKSPFHLETPPLYRVKLVKCDAEEFDLILTMHHIITDGWSMDVLEREFTQLYDAYKAGKEIQLPPLRLQYRDYAHWHNRSLSNKEEMEEAAAFWKSRIHGHCPVLDLPYDFPGGSRNSKESAGYRIVVPAKITDSLRTLAKEHKASLFMVLTAAFTSMISRITGQNDILMGMPGAARQHDDLKGIVGVFVNTLIFRETVKPGEPFTLLLRRVRENIMQVLEYQGYPLELICKEYKIKYPEISVFFNMSTFDNALQRSITDEQAFHIETVQNAKFDLVGYLGEYKNGIEIIIHYYKQLFKPLTIEKMLNSYVSILEHISTPSSGDAAGITPGPTGKARKIKRKGANS